MYQILLAIPDAFSAIKYISHPITLVAYIGAAILTFHLFKLKTERKKIEAVKESERSKVMVQTAEKLRIRLKDVPESERSSLILQVLKNRIYLNIISAITIIIIGFFIVYILEKNDLPEPIKEPVEEKSYFDSLGYQKTQKSFSIIGIDLEGHSIDIFLDSLKISTDWKKWLGTEPIILNKITGIYDTLKKLSTFAFDPGYLNTDDSKIFRVRKNGQILQIKNKKFKYRFAGVDPNELPTFYFWATSQVAETIMGIDPLCAEKCYEYYERNDIHFVNSLIPRPLPIYYNECFSYLTTQAANYINKSQNEYYYTPQILLYSYICQNYVPKEFILLQGTKTITSGDECDPIPEYYFHYTTPIMRVKCIVIRNVSKEPLVINNIKFLITNSDSLKTINEVKKVFYKNFNLTIKIQPGSDIIIPSAITFTPLEKISNGDEILKTTSSKSTYYYGSAVYIDSININGFKYSIKEFDKTDTLSAFFEGKYYLEIGGSCPYIYTFSQNSKDYIIENHILSGVNAKHKERYDTLRLKNPTYKLLLKEIDPETSFIDELFILCIDKSGKETKFKSKNRLLTQRDNKYLSISQGQEVSFEVEKFNLVSTCKYYLVSYGYYAPKSLY